MVFRLFAAVSLSTIAAYAMSQTVQMKWSNVSIGGGGYVTEVLTHPKERDLVYTRTDTGGFYRWDRGSSRWLPLTDWIAPEEADWYGGEAIALDPNDPARVYIACGKHAQPWSGVGALFVSRDRGRTWAKSDLAVKMGGNEDKRWASMRLAVDPHDGDRLLFGSRNDGLWVSLNRGEHWTRSAYAWPKAKPGVGLLSIAFDPAVKGRVYLNAYGDGIYRSIDSGRTWELLPGTPSSANRIAVSKNGVLFVTGEAGVFRFRDGFWADVTPSGASGSYCGISVDPWDPRDVIVATGEQNLSRFYRSRDAGDSWLEQPRKLDVRTPWYSDFMRSNPWVADVEFDQAVPGRAWFTDWYATYRTDDIDRPTPLWTNPMDGHEQTVVFALACPESGADLFTGLADVEGFRHLDLTKPPERQLGGPDAVQDTYGFAWAASDPNRLWRVCADRWGTHPGFVYGSEDQGKTWTRHESWDSGAVPLRIAVSATDSANAVVLVSGGFARVTTDRGGSFGAVSGLPSGPQGPWWYSQPLAADSVSSGTFYYYDSGRLYASSDGGRTFAVRNARLPSSDHCDLRAVSGSAGRLILALGDAGLYASSDGGGTFQRLPGMARASLVAVGASAPGSRFRSLYVFGSRAGRSMGFYRSTDDGKTWSRLVQTGQSLGDQPQVLEASRRRFGIVFVGTNGRGVFVGECADAAARR